MKTFFLFCGALIMGAFPSYASAESQKTQPQAQLMFGAFYSNGQNESVSTTNSEIIGFPVGLSYQDNRWSASVFTSYLRTYRYDQVKLNKPVSGMGDTFLSVGYDLMQAPWATLSLNHKLPTGSVDNGTSTGKSDTGVQLDYFSSLSDTQSIFSSLSYKVTGKVDGVDMKDPIFASVGLSQSISASTYIGASLDYNQSIYKSVSDTTGVTVFSGVQVDKRRQLFFSGSYDSSKNYQFGINFSLQLLQ